MQIQVLAGKFQSLHIIVDDCMHVLIWESDIDMILKNLSTSLNNKGKMFFLFCFSHLEMLMVGLH